MEQEVIFGRTASQIHQRPVSGGWLLLPREHGAWGLLLQPFLCAAILARRWDWLYLPALTLALTVFVMREPLLIVARQKWRWREPKPEYASARRCLFWQVPLAAALFLLCVRFLPAAQFLPLAGMGAAITSVAVWMTLCNRQRSIALQMLSSVGLASSGLLAALVGVRDLPAWSWLLCGLLALHAIASILVVRSRLEQRSGSRAGLIRTWAWTVLAIQGCLAIALLLREEPGLALVIGFSTVVNALELWRLRSRGALAEPLTRVGFRTLGASLAHSIFTVAVLW
jgi:hypothetical protein